MARAWPWSSATRCYACHSAKAAKPQGGLLLDLAGLAWFLYNGWLNGTTGKSIGHQVAGVKVIRSADGELMNSGGLGIVRWLAHIVDSIICYIGWLFPLWDSKKQTMADKIMSTVVIVDKT